MFTGIVEETGEVLATDSQSDGRRLRLGTTFAGLERGQSVCVSGACLTVESHGEGWFEVFLASETVERTYLGTLDVGDVVNLERALPTDGRLDGHVVQGHVDGTGEVADVTVDGEDLEIAVATPPALDRYLVEKGSIAVDGVSLTVADRDADAFSVALIPETAAVTNLGEKAVGDPVHLEVDVLAKYVERLLPAVQDGNAR